MIQIYLFLGAGLGLVFLLFFQGVRVGKINRLKEKVAEKIKREKRKERVLEAKRNREKVEEERKNKKKKRYEHLPEIKELFRQSEAEWARGNWEHAEELLLQLLALDPEHKESRERLGLIYLKTEREKKAEIIYIDLVKEDERNAAVISNLGLAYYKQKMYRKAIRYYEKAIQVDSKKPERYASVGQIYLLVNQPKKALENFECAYRRRRGNVEYLFLISEAQKQLGDWEASKKTLEKVLSFQPYNQTAKDELRKMVSNKTLGGPEV